MHEHWLSERRRFLLHTARIRNHQVRAAQQVDESRVVQWRQQHHVAQSPEPFRDGPEHVGISVDGVDHLRVAAPRQLLNRAANPRDALAEVLPAVRRYQHEFPPVVDPGPFAGLESSLLSPSTTWNNASIPEFPVMKIRSAGVPSASRFRRARSVGAKCSSATRPVTTRFNSSGNGRARSPVRSPASTCATGMRAVEGGQRPGHCSGRVALYHDHRGRLRRQDRIYAAEHAPGDLRQRLIRCHEVQVIIGRDVEAREDLVEHRAMLGGDTDARLELFAGKPQAPDHRAQLDCLGPGPENEEDRFHNAQCNCSSGAGQNFLGPSHLGLRRFRVVEDHHGDLALAFAFALLCPRLLLPVVE